MAQETLEGLRFAPVDRGNWCDLAGLFESRGGPKYCWCMAWRRKPPDAKGGSAAERQAALKRALESQVEKGVAVGLLAYDGSAPVAWCSVGPRESYRRLGGQELEGERSADVWSIVCFFLRREFRRSGVVARLIEAAKDYAAANGATVLEAYPVEPDSPSYRFMGTIPVFEAAGFRGCGRAGTRRHVMRFRMPPSQGGKLAPGSSRAPLPPEDVIARSHNDRRSGQERRGDGFAENQYPDAY